MSLIKQRLAPAWGATYDTRPMPEDGARLCDVGALADEGRRFEVAIPVARFERIAGALARRDGMVTGSVAFGREEGRIIAEVSLVAQLTPRCQRCLEPMPLDVASRSRVALVASEAQGASIPPELEVALAPEGRLRLTDLVEEELLLALPAAPRHEGNCPGEARPAQDGVARQTQRPFAALGAMWPDRSKQ